MMDAKNVVVSKADTLSRESRFFVGPNGWKIHWRLSTVPQAKARLILVHGYTEHSGRYPHFVKFLNENFFDVAMMDWPGHGLSEGPHANIDQFQDYITTLERFIQELIKEGYIGPYYLFAHSLGGLISIRFLQTSESARTIRRAVLSSPLLGLSPTAFHGLGTILQSSWGLGLLGAICGLLPNFRLVNRRDLGGSVLTHDLEIQEARRTDPLIKPEVTLHWFREFVKARRLAFLEVSRLATPLAIFQAGEDFVVSRAETERFYKLLPDIQKQLCVYEGKWHELVNETNRIEVMNEILNWFELDQTEDSR